MVAQAMKESAVAAKRRQALKLIAEFSFGSTSVSSLPTPLLEVPKQVVLTATDLTLCWRLYALYYDETLSLDSLLALLKRAGVITVVGGVSVYAGARSLQGMVDEALNLTIVGTIFSGFIAGSYTAGFGLAFLYWVDRCWQQDQPTLLEGAGQRPDD